MMTDSPQGRRFMADINVIPLVDVVLVLLVIFMITAPLLYRGIDIDLPNSATNSIKPTERIILTVSDAETVYVNDSKVPLVDLRKNLEDIKLSTPDVAIYLRGNETVPYGVVIEVMDLVKQAGIERLGMVTEPTSNPKFKGRL